MLSAKNEEKEHLYDEIELLKQDIVELEAEQEQQQRRQPSVSGSPSAEELHGELDRYRDKLAAATLDLDRREKEIEELNNDLNARETEHEQELAKITNEWREALEETRRDKDQLTDVRLARSPWRF